MKFQNWLSGIFRRQPAPKNGKGPAMANRRMLKTAPASPRPSTPVRPAPAPAAVTPVNPSPVVPRPSAPAPAPLPAPAADELRLPLSLVIPSLSVELQKLIKPDQIETAFVALSAEAVLAQLGQGVVRVSFGDVRKCSPAAFTAGPEHDAVMVSLPPKHLVSRLGASALQRRAQKKVDLPEHITGPFDPNGLWSTGIAGRPKPASTPPSSNGSPTSSPAALPTRQDGGVSNVEPPRPPEVQLPTPALPETSSGRPRTPVALDRETPPVEEPPTAVEAPADTSPIESSEAPISALPAPGISTPLPPAVEPLAALTTPPAEPLPELPEVITSLPESVPADAELAPAAASETPEPPGESSAPEEILEVSLAQLITAWPPALQTVAARWDSTGAKACLPVRIVEAALKSGKLALNWQELCALTKPPPPTPQPEYALVPMSLSLTAVAVPFFARQKNRPGLSTASEAVEPKATETVRAAQDEAEPDEAVSVEPARISAIGSAALREATAESLEVTPDDVVAEAAKLPGVEGALIALPDGLLVASKLSASLDANLLAARLPEAYLNMRSWTKELRLGELCDLTFTAGDKTWKILRVNGLFFAAIGRVGINLPGDELAWLAAKLKSWEGN